MAMLLARNAMRSAPKRNFVGVQQRRFLNNDFTTKDTSALIPNSARLGGSSGRIEKTVPLGAWYDPAVLPLYVTIGAGCIMCTYVCALKMSTHPDVVWYKSKYSSDVDGAVMNSGNIATSYGEQRLFLATGNERSTRLLGGALFSGTNQVYAHKHGDKKAEMQF